MHNADFIWIAIFVTSQAFMLSIEFLYIFFYTSPLRGECKNVIKLNKHLEMTIPIKLYCECSTKRLSYVDILKIHLRDSFETFMV